MTAPLVRLCAALVLALSCEPGAPDWVEGASGEHPEPAFVSARGTGSDAERAETNAIDLLVQKVAGVWGDESPDVDAFFVAETWHAPDGVTHALAVLDRVQVVQRFRDRAAIQHERATSLAQEAHAASDVSLAARAWLDAVDAAGRAAAWQHRAALLEARREGSGAVAAPPAPEVVTPTPTLGFVVQAVRSEDGRREIDPELEAGLASLLLRRGFPRAGGADTEHAIHLGCRVALAPQPAGPLGWSEVRWDGTCDATRRGAPWITAARAGGERLPKAASARERAREKANDTLTQAVDERLAVALDEPPTRAALRREPNPETKEDADVQAP